MTLVESRDKCVREAAPVLKTGRKWSAKKAVEDAKAALRIGDTMIQEIKYIMVTEGMRDYQWLRALLLNTTVSRGPYLEMRPRSYFGTDFTPEKYLVAHPDFNRYIKNRFLKSKTVEGKSWAIYRPSTGAFALLLALHLCDVVDAYGYITEDYAKYPNHYYDKTKTETEFYGNHDYALELKEWKKLHDNKIMNLYQGR